MKNLESLALKRIDGRLKILDQTLLPLKEQWIDIESPDRMVEVIKSLQVRGAPLIGVAAALALAQFVLAGADIEKFRTALQKLRAARPTAVNLMKCLDRMLAAAETKGLLSVVNLADEIFYEDVKLCDKIAENGLAVIAEGDGILTHCNTGGLATAGVGTALGVIAKAFKKGIKIHVFVDETRPLLQGGRLTTWECQKLGIPYTLICDNMAASLMQKKRVQKVIVGADRIAANGDFANKVGTYNLAVLCNYHEIPFYVAAPYTTVDLFTKTGAEIEIEERSSEEVLGVSGSFGQVRWAPLGSVWNPAFDVTPAALVSGWILDQGLYSFADIKKGALCSR